MTCGQGNQIVWNYSQSHHHSFNSILYDINVEVGECHLLNTKLLSFVDCIFEHPNHCLFLYHFYLPPLSQPNNMYVCLLHWSFHVYGLNIIITKHKSYATLLAHFKRSCCEVNTTKHITPSYFIHQTLKEK